jgi:murein DD-endopeptidase MepM/ murein hydrolase activator NlpD
MIRRTLPLVLLAVAACSQRAPWTAVNSVSPKAAPAATVSSQPAAAVAPVRANSSLPSLSMVARAPEANDATAVAHLRSLLLPVGGVENIRLDDSFDALRDGGARKHNAIDILAPRGTPVVSASDGRILRLQKNPKGGLTLYATDLEGQFVYYYAHFDRYHPKIYSGKPLMRGDTLGFVGTTGNAPPNLPHLHFQVMRMPSDGKYVNGTPINPYPLLRQSASGEK